MTLIEFAAKLGKQAAILKIANYPGCHGAKGKKKKKGAKGHGNRIPMTFSH